MLTADLGQKMAQRDAAQMTDLLEIACLWTSIAPELAKTFGKEGADKLNEMFSQGCLGEYCKRC